MTVPYTTDYAKYPLPDALAAAAILERHAGRRHLLPTPRTIRFYATSKQTAYEVDIPILKPISTNVPYTHHGSLVRLAVTENLSLIHI